MAAPRVVPLGRACLTEATELLVRACPYDRVADVAEEKLLGDSPLPSVVLAAVEGEQLLGVAVAAGRWLRLLAVDPGARGQGVGSALLGAIAQASGEGPLRTADQPGNYLSPGIDGRDGPTLAWLARRGFARVRENENLRVPLLRNPLCTDERAEDLAQKVESQGYALRYAGEGDREALLTLVYERYSAAWAFEIARALEIHAVHLACKNGVIAAFAAHDGNNRGLGWFGPAATLEAHRGKGLGHALLLRCLQDIRRAGHEAGVIAWIGPREFYARAVGAVQDRCFVVLERTP